MRARFRFVGRALLFTFFRFVLDTLDQLMRSKVKCSGDAPDGFKVGLLRAAFNHGNMAARQSCKSTEHFLRQAFFLPQIIDRSRNGHIVEFYHRRHLLEQE